MKYLKILLLLISFSSISNASYLYDAQSVCIDNFYVKNGSIYFLASADSLWYSSTALNTVSGIHDGFIFDFNTSICSMDTALMLGMDTKDFNFLMAFIGLIFGGSFMFFTIQLFTNVGGKK